MLWAEMSYNLSDLVEIVHDEIREQSENNKEEE